MSFRKTTHCFAKNNAVGLPEVILNSKTINEKYREYIPINYLSMLESALKEDINCVDVTSLCLVSKNRVAHAEIKAKEQGAIACLFIVKDVYSLVDKDVSVSLLRKDGDRVKSGDVVAEVFGPADSIFKGERVALNFLQHFSGIATLSRKFADKVKKYPVKILDTRKTLPLYRFLEKYAVRVGGCFSHRFGLDDMILIKRNHVDLNGGIKNAMELIGKSIRKDKLVEVEVRNLNELREAVSFSPDIIMLDNMKIQDVKKARTITPSRIKLEVSGNINLKNVERVAQTGVDFISIGAITHSAKALDLSLIIK